MDSLVPTTEQGNQHRDPAEIIYQFRIATLERALRTKDGVESCLIVGISATRCYE